MQETKCKFSTEGILFPSAKAALLSQAAIWVRGSSSSVLGFSRCSCRRVSSGVACVTVNLLTIPRGQHHIRNVMSDCYSLFKTDRQADRTVGLMYILSCYWKESRLLDRSLHQSPSSWCWWGETISLNCSHQRAYCLPQVIYEHGNNGETIMTGKTHDFSTSTFWQFCQQSSNSKACNLGKGIRIVPYELFLSYFEGFFNMP
jgi:hypothetical protein